MDHPRGPPTRRTHLFTVGGIGTHWGLAAALYGREHGLRTMLGLVDQPVDDHVRAQLARLERAAPSCTATATRTGSGSLRPA